MVKCENDMNYKTVRLLTHAEGHPSFVLDHPAVGAQEALRAEQLGLRPVGVVVQDGVKVGSHLMDIGPT